MKGQPNRLILDGLHQLGGTAIDRSLPVQFRLDGLPISGFSGDTVLSAALASGVDTVGEHRGWPMALSRHFSPALVPTAARRDTGQAMDMARTPATDGADYQTLGGGRRRNAIADMLGRLRGGRRSLGIDLDRRSGLERPWLTAPSEPAPATDLIVVGAGVAGLAAAVAGARAGLRVTVLETTSQIGGQARLFGTQDGEETPEQTITQLSDAVSHSDAITVVLNADVFALRQGIVRAHVIALESGTPVGRVLDFSAPHIVLATGAIERLPIFPGNRLPGVVGAAEAHALAHHFGIWPGRTLALATVSSPVYRLGMLANDAGREVKRVIDGRPDPQSRFIAFSKAYGITMAAGTIPAWARPDPKSRTLALVPHLSIGGLDRPEPEVLVDRLIVCGGWQPDLTLWHMAGGESQWNDTASRIEPLGMVEGIALAGSAAGLLTRKACLVSGNRAVELLLGRSPPDIGDILIDPIYETPDGASQMAERDETQPPAYLGIGHSLLDRPVLRKSGWPAWLPFAPRSPGWQLAETPHPLEITDITAGVQLGAIPAASAGIVAQERVAMALLAKAPPAAMPTASIPLDAVPPYLVGRFGGAAQIWAVAPNESRTLDTGALVFRSFDESDPLAAVGVIIRPMDGGAVALLDSAVAQAGGKASLRDGGRAIAIRLVAPYRPGLDLGSGLIDQSQKIKLAANSMADRKV